MKKIAILGFGREGRSVLRFIGKRSKHRNADIWILDKNPRVPIPKGILSRLGKNYLRGLDRFDLIFRSPGVPYNFPELARACSAGVQFSSATKLFFQLCQAKIIGITGTKGKGTVATLLCAILKAAGRDVFLAGNIGTSPLDILPRLKKNSLAILELSSFQLHDLDASPHIAVILDVFPDHQDSHRTLAEYYGAKANIARHQKKNDTVFFLANNRLSRRLAMHGTGKKIPVDEKRFALFEPDEVNIPGLHNFKNAAIASAVAKYLGVPAEVIKKAVRNFAGNEHRLEPIRRIGSIPFYNDSASTIPHAAAAAVLAFRGTSSILIAGGRSKVTNYLPLARALKNSPPLAVVLFGENKEKIRRAIKKTGRLIRYAPDLSKAINTAYHIAKGAKGKTVVLFSPGAASFDMFKNYEERGALFKKLVARLGERSHPARRAPS